MAFLNGLIRAIKHEWALFMETVGSAEFREVLVWCAPALALGFIARALLTIHFPYGYFQEDSADFLVTAERFTRHHDLVIHGKKTFLAPILFTIPFLLHIPALIAIPLAQHVCGLVATVATGVIVRCWFRLWRWFIVPLTILYTLNPALLWYEHALLAEAVCLFSLTGLALAGTLLVQRATLRRFVWLIVALFFTAGSRPEGKLFVMFGLGVTALAYFGDWKIWMRRMAVMVVCSAAIWMSSRSTQAGLLLYGTVLPMAPDTSAVAPGVEAFINPIRAAAVSTARTKYNSVERRANEALKAYLKSIGRPSGDRNINALAQKLALEAIGRRPLALPILAADKFLITCRPEPDGTYMDTSGGYDSYWIYDKQRDALERRKFISTLMPGLSGRVMNDDAAIENFLKQEYTVMAPDWFTPLQKAWSKLTLGLQWGSHGADKRFIPGWPAFCLVAAAGMLVSLIPRDRLWRFHLPWVGTLMGVWFAVMLTGIVLPRYRFVFEPFFLIYALLVLDFLLGSVLRCQVNADKALGRGTGSA